MITPFSLTTQQLSRIADAETQRITARFSTEHLPGPELLKSAAGDARNHILDALWDAYIHSPAGKALPADERNALKFDFRELALPLTIPAPVPRQELRASVMPLSAAVGALAGMAVMTPLVRLLFGADYREFGLLAGAPLGALLVVAGIRYVSHHTVLLRSLQAVLGLTTAAEVVSLFLSPLNPFRLVWRAVTSRFGGKGLWGSIKRVVFFIIGILLLQLAVPVKKTAREQLKVNCTTAITSWLNTHALLLSLVAESAVRKPVAAHKEKTERHLLRAIAKLLQSHEQEYPVLAAEIIVAGKNAGYTFQPPIPVEEYYPDLRQYYTTEGLIETGDPVRILEPALFKNGECILKGTLTRKRD